MEGIIENVSSMQPSVFSESFQEYDMNLHINELNEEQQNKNRKCYTCKPRGTIKEHIISQSEHFTFNHDMFRRPLIIITSKDHYHTIYDMPDAVKLKLFSDINTFVEFWNLNTNYQFKR